jgi:hypothetical protein
MGVRSSASTLITARSFSGIPPTTSPFRRPCSPSLNCTRTSMLHSTTWKFVRIVPLSSITTPEPSPSPAFVSTLTFTTEGRTSATISAMGDRGGGAGSWRRSTSAAGSSSSAISTARRRPSIAQALRTRTSTDRSTSRRLIGAKDRSSRRLVARLRAGTGNQKPAPAGRRKGKLRQPSVTGSDKCDGPIRAGQGTDGRPPVQAARASISKASMSASPPFIPPRAKTTL